MLKIQFKDNRKPAMWLVDSSLKIGSDPACEIVVDEQDVDNEHCELLIDHDDITLTNLSQNRSVFVNDIPVVKTHKLVAWDVIKLGNSELEIIDPLNENNAPKQAIESNKTVIRPAISAWMLKANSAPLTGQFFPVNSGFVIGRDESADIVVPLSFISRSHAKLSVKKERLYLEDMGSSNGTFVNDEKIKSTELKNNDVISLDEFSFSVVGPDIKEKAIPPTTIKEKKKPVKKKTTSTGKSKIVLASKKVFLHDLSSNSTGKIYEIVHKENHLSKMLGHHISTSEISVSARHIHLNEEDIGWEIVNNGAADGLLINSKMQIRAVLNDGDELIVGGTKLQFQSKGDIPLSLYTPRSDDSGLSMVTKVVGALVVIGVAIAIAINQSWI